MSKQDKWLANQFRDTNHFKFTIIEEKRKDHTGSKLEKWEAQVIGEALAMYVLHFECLTDTEHSLTQLAENRVIFPGNQVMYLTLIFIPQAKLCAVVYQQWRRMAVWPFERGSPSEGEELSASHFVPP